MTSVSLPSIFLLILAMASACLITNCPRGGKRNGARPVTNGATEELPFCTLCGPAERGGLCVSPTMCCSPLGGCEVGGPHASECLGIQGIPPLCRIPSQRLPVPAEAPLRCGSGFCTSSGLCCSSDWCRADERCLLSGVEPSSNTNLVIPERSLQSNLRLEQQQQPSFNEWHSTDNAERSPSQTYHI